jgi:TolB-like protein
MKRLIILFIILICFMPKSTFASKIGILHLKADILQKETADAVANLIASELSNYEHQVLNPDAMDAAIGEKIKCYESNCAAEAGFKAEVEQVVFGSLLRLGEKYIVQVSVIKVSTREIVWSGDLAAKNVEDLDVVAKRLAKSITEGKKTTETVEIGIVTQEEEKEPGRRRAFFVTGGKFGALLPLGGYGGSGALMYGAFTVWYEIPNMAAELSYDFGFSGDLVDIGEGKANEQIIDISVLYFFNKTDFSPFIKGGAGMSMLGLYDDQGHAYGTGMGAGFGANLGGGLVMFRTYDFRLVVEGTYHINLTRVSGFDFPHHGPKFMLGLLYRARRRGCGSGGCLGGCL